ncbi:hypothetical protein L3073_17355 [Ancylomarina sp. DW003]|nr:hypothetical protein [Ancylomarina sp. DW003]MDE5423985.1 hypothetical protein [Ancylomarina sp. DW003]
MNRLIYLLLLQLSIYSCSYQKKESHFQWNLEKERIHNENRNDLTKISSKNWISDTKDISISGDPLIQGVFPVPDYDLADSTFNGVGYSGAWKGIRVNDKTIVYHSLFVNQSNVNKALIPNKKNEVFFTIVALTDTIDLKAYSHTSVSITSRNHPHYVGQGFVKTKSNQIDFVSFIMADRNAYALVNMRLFDLRIGSIVLIAPQKDGSLRSLQIDSPNLSSDEMDKHIKNLLKNNELVINFFTKTNNI